MTHSYCHRASTFTSTQVNEALGVNGGSCTENKLKKENALIPNNMNNNKEGIVILTKSLAMSNNEVRASFENKRYCGESDLSITQVQMALMLNSRKLKSSSQIEKEITNEELINALQGKFAINNNNNLDDVIAIDNYSHKIESDNDDEEDKVKDSSDLCNSEVYYDDNNNTNEDNNNNI